jgi:hypothetical protein
MALQPCRGIGFVYLRYNDPYDAGNAKYDSNQIQDIYDFGGSLSRRIGLNFFSHFFLESVFGLVNCRHPIAVIVRFLHTINP